MLPSKRRILQETEIIVTTTSLSTGFVNFSKKLKEWRSRLSFSCGCQGVWGIFVLVVVKDSLLVVFPLPPTHSWSLYFTLLQPDCYQVLLNDDWSILGLCLSWLLFASVSSQWIRWENPHHQHLELTFSFRIWLLKERTLNDGTKSQHLRMNVFE
jgi:hypothetical protein